MNTFYWHDYETSGVHPARDRPVQFAGIRTDEELNIVGDPLVVYCKPSIDVLPAPEACLVTGITPQLAEREGITEPEFIAKIHRELATPGTCGVGYNSIRFDDEVTRYSLYRNFYDPYAREWQNGNSRWDIIDMVRLTRALRPEGIEWPDREDGGPDFRLERLTAANGIGHESAHDALSDVHATIELARLIRNRQPKLFDYVCANRSKQRVADVVNLNRPKPFLHVSSRLPRRNDYVGLMYPLARHPTNSNGIVCFNLSGDIAPLLEESPEVIREKLFTPASELSEGESRILLKAVHLNRCPVVATAKLLDPDTADRLNIDLLHCEANWRRLASEDLREKIAAVFSEPFASDCQDAEQLLYQGFLPDQDKPLLTQVRESAGGDPGNEWPTFSDSRYRQLLFLYRARHFASGLDESEREAWQAHCGDRLIEGKDGYLSLAAFESRIEEMAATEHLPEGKLTVLEQLRQWAGSVKSGLV
ncbi:MAG: exodeoxyribonuclease I [bacterium]